MTLLDVEMPKTTAMFQWFGAARLVAQNVGRELDGCNFVAVPFAGGMCELLYIKARTLVVSDLHRHAINCASVAADPVLGPKLYRRLRRMVFHPDRLSISQRRCREREHSVAPYGLFNVRSEVGDQDKLDWAVDYFICTWMARGGTAGTPGEFTGKMSVRLDAGGGDSATRFYSASNGLPAWRRVLRRCTFVTASAFDLIPTLKDQEGHGLYVDSPWPDAGDGYTYRFNGMQQRELARMLSRFEKTRVVVRYGDHEMIRELYPEPEWTWKLQTSRTRTNADCPEALIVRNGL